MDILRECSRPEQFLKCVFQVREEKKYRDARTIFRKLRLEMESQDFKSVEKLRNEMNEVAERATEKPLMMQHGEIHPELSGRARWAQEYIRGISKKDLREVNSKLAKLFPEVLPTDKVSQFARWRVLHWSQILLSPQLMVARFRLRDEWNIIIHSLNHRAVMPLNSLFGLRISKQ